MQDNYFISFDEIKKAVIDAKNFGVPAILLVNGEYYEIKPETIPDCEKINAGYTYYMRKNHPAHFTPWKASDGDNKYNFVVLYNE